MEIWLTYVVVATIVSVCLTALILIGFFIWAKTFWVFVHLTTPTFKIYRITKILAIQVLYISSVFTVADYVQTGLQAVTLLSAGVAFGWWMGRMYVRFMDDGTKVVLNHESGDEREAVLAQWLAEQNFRMPAFDPHKRVFRMKRFQPKIAIEWYGSRYTIIRVLDR